MLFLTLHLGSHLGISRRMPTTIPTSKLWSNFYLRWWYWPLCPGSITLRNQNCFESICLVIRTQAVSESCSGTQTPVQFSISYCVNLNLTLKISSSIAKRVVEKRFQPGESEKRDMLGSFIRHGLTPQEAEGETAVQMYILVFLHEVWFFRWQVSVSQDLTQQRLQSVPQCFISSATQ